MPTVPVYNSPQVAPQRAPNVSQNLDTRGTSGEAIGQGLQNLGGSLYKIQQEIKQVDDQAIIKQRMSDLRATINKRQFTDDDAYFSRQGENAYKSFDSHKAELDEITRKQGEGLTPDQQYIFKNLSQQYLDNENEAMGKHVLKTRQQYLNNEDEATAMQAIEDGSLRWDKVGVYSKQIKDTANNLAKRGGWSPEQKDLYLKEKLTTLHVTAIDNILASPNSGQAETYFAANSDEIAGSVQGKVLEKIKGVVTAKQGLSLADEIFSTSETTSEMTARAREVSKDNPELRDILNRRLDAQIRRKKNNDIDASMEWYNQASEDLANSNTEATIDQWALEHPDKWELILPEHRDVLRKGKKVETNTQVYYEIKGLLVAGKTDEARDLISRSVNSNLNTTDAKKLIDQMTKPPKEQKPLISDIKAFDEMAEQMLGKAPKKGTPADVEWSRKRTVMAGMYDERISEWLKSNPTKQVIPADDRKKILDDFKAEMTQKDSFLWFDSDITVADIPADDLEQISAKLKADGYPVSTENILQLYVRSNK